MNRFVLIAILSLSFYTVNCSNGKSGNGIGQNEPQTGDTSQKQNRTPIANAGEDQSIVGDTIIMLDGAKSSDPDGDSLIFKWNQTLGDKVVLSDSTATKPTFTAPRKRQDLVFSLVVSDSKLESSADEVKISIQNNSPSANAGPDEASKWGATVQLDGTKSSDPDGDSLTYEWSITQQASIPASLSSNNTAKTTLTIPNSTSTKPEVYTVTLTVTDTLGAKSSDEIKISVNNSAPMIDKVTFIYDPMMKKIEGEINDHLDMKCGDTIKIKALTSDADKDPITYEWKMENELSSPAIQGSPTNQEVSIYMPEIVGSFGKLILKISDGNISTQTAISIQGWKRVSYSHNTTPKIESSFFVGNLDCDSSSPQGSINCPYKTLDDTFNAKPKESDIYMLGGSYALTTLPDKNFNSLMGGFELKDGRWIRPGIGTKGNLNRSKISISNVENALIDYNSTTTPPKIPISQIEISGLDVHSSFASSSGNPQTNLINIIGSQSSAIRMSVVNNIFISKLDNLIGAGNFKQIYGKDISLAKIENNSFSHTVTNKLVQNIIYDIITLERNAKEHSNIQIVKNNFDIPFGLGCTIFIDKGYAIYISDNIIRDKIDYSNDAASAIRIVDSEIADIQGNTILLGVNRPQINGIHISSLKKTSIYKNIIFTPSTEPVDRAQAVSLVNIIESADLHNNTLVLENDNNSFGKNTLLSCNTTVNKMSIDNNIFYIGKGKNDDGSGNFDGKTGIELYDTCDLVSLKSNNFYFYGAGSKGNSVFIKDLNPTRAITSIQDAELRFPTIANGNLEEDPMFIAPDNFDYHLAKGSPLVNIGAYEK